MTRTDTTRDNALSIVGIGYGGDVTARASELLGRADLVVGHPDFIRQVAHLLKPGAESTDVVADAEPGQDVFALRARLAAEALASGKRAVIVTAGDPGLLGMAGPTLSALRGQVGLEDVGIVPGLSAWQYASAMLGAPFNGGLVTFPLCLHGESDADVARRVRSAADSGLGTCLYMLRHNGEAHPELFPTDEPAVEIALRRFAMVRDAFLAARPEDTPAVIVSDLDHERPRRVTTSLLDLKSVWDEVTETSVLCIPGERFAADSGRLWTVT
ncbi:SAM-dependent methyltransferase [Streptomyces sp. NBC_00249]|uniref:SAM-dependent methyltransferase n=1 Tax=Streptomyces sp. NBC_00249 TaxID=2975690 RepID=UPI0022527076|nr:SAM-dependent methyltransferase [Streptomyces sp. NBC_00249]MCX5195076.1 SAM-dependent methyltransferase [Streptomyces sp. NBC_00249]